MAEESKLKTWQKAGILIVTVGLTATACYFGYKAIKKAIDKKKKAKEGEAPVPKIEVKKEEIIKLTPQLQAQADKLAKAINNQYDIANKQRGGITGFDNNLIQGWLTDLEKMGFNYDNKTKKAVFKKYNSK